MAASPYMVTRDTGQGMASPTGLVKKDDKYWERRRWDNNIISIFLSVSISSSIYFRNPPKTVSC